VGLIAGVIWCTLGTMILKTERLEKEGFSGKPNESRGYEMAKKVRVGGGNVRKNWSHNKKRQGREIAK